MNEHLTSVTDNGFGESTVAELAELRKALEIGYQQPTTGTGFDALRVESLEATLKLLTFTQKDIKFWQDIPKLDAYSTVEEYNRLVQYGAEGGGFVASGELPETEDTTYERADQKVKYFGTTREVHHPATMVRTVPPDLIAQETSNGALWLMGKINRALYYADSDAIPLEFNSVTKQIEDGSGTIIDMRGLPMDKDSLENAITISDENFGSATSFYSNPKVFTDFSKTVYDRQRTQLGQGGMAGTPIKGYSSLLGDINFLPDKFVKKGGAAPAAATSPKAPTKPTITYTPNTGVTGSLFGAADAANYKYQVTAVNQYGESEPTALSAAQAIAAAGSCTVAIADGGGLYPATAYKIYRTGPGGAAATYTGKIVPRTKSGNVYSSPTSWDDINAYLPSTFVGLLLDMSTQALSFKQLSPMIKMPLAIVAPAIRWMQLLYGTPIVYAPKKHVIFRNIGIQS